MQFNFYLKFISLVIYVIINLLFFNHSYLYDQDEAAYAGFARNMIQTNDFVVMDFPFSEPHRKPPLHFWITCFAFKIFGESEFSLRLFPSVWIFLTCLLTYLFSKKLYNPKIGILSFFILSCSLYFPLNGKLALVDGLLTFLQFSALYLLYLHFFENHSYAKYLFWIILALGALTKGPPIYIFTGGILFFAIFHKELRAKVFLLYPWFFLPLSLIPLLVWGYLAWERTNGELIRWMLDWYVIRRATSSVFGQQGPPGTYLLIFFVTFFPWSFFLPKVLRDLYNQIKEIVKHYKSGIQINSLDYFILISLLSGWIIYEFMMSKLPSYVLSVYPVISILIARKINENYTENEKKVKIMGVITILFSLGIQIFLIYFNNKRKDTFELANQIKQNIRNSEIIYFDKDYGIPSLAYYLDFPKQKLKVLKSLEDLKNLEEGSLLVLDEDSSFTLLQHFLKLQIISQKRVFLYDRNRYNNFMIVRIISQ